MTSAVNQNMPFLAPLKAPAGQNKQPQNEKNLSFGDALDLETKPQAEQDDSKRPDVDLRRRLDEKLDAVILKTSTFARAETEDEALLAKFASEDAEADEKDARPAPDGDENTVSEKKEPQILTSVAVIETVEALPLPQPKADPDTDEPKPQMRVDGEKPANVGNQPASNSFEAKAAARAQAAEFVPSSAFTEASAESTKTLSASSTSDASPAKKPAPAAPDRRIEMKAPESISARVTVISEQTIAAPATNQVIDALSDAFALRAAPKSAPAAAVFSGVQTQSSTNSVHTLKIQLHPAELGMVTANLRLAGDQLRVEIQVDTKEAHQRLSSDKEIITKALKGLGFEIDQISIIQSQAAINPATRNEASGQSFDNSGRPQQNFQSNGSGESNSGSNGRNSSNEGDGNGGARPNSAPAVEPRSGGGLYI
ncbi:flagellar hook-length control protein FliK [Mesorhizobium sp. SB112]|uniref:flagellar hook-length control protein FliK n=1 Tax=Mesorhizobium sp. SB112 TaxID=3151853 RepID=UPI0032664778